MVKKETLLYYARDEEEKILLSKIYDNYLKTREKNYNTYSDFISEEKKELLEILFKDDKDVTIKTNGGYEGAERVVSAFLANEDESFPIESIELKGRNIDTLTHRDILGALMGLGIKRETVGDILTGSVCVVFVKKEIAEYIILNLTKAGKVSLSCDYYKGEEISKEEKTEIINTTISSNRLDLILTAGFKIKRSDAARYISQGKVMVAHRAVLNSDMRVKENEKITLRGYGKIIYNGDSGTSKKGKLIVNIKRFL